MKKRTILIVLAAMAVLATLVPLSRALAGFLPQPAAQRIAQENAQTVLPMQEGEPIPDLSTLLDYPYPVSITKLEGPDAAMARDMLLSRPETEELRDAMAGKGFVFNPESADVMRIETEVLGPDGTMHPIGITAMTMSTIHEELSGALTAMVSDSDVERGFFQAHHTNLDPKLAEVPDPPIVVNGMPYFYVTTLRWIGGQFGGRIITWRYWWYDSHHHPNWYYSHYYWYWRYYWWYRVDWPYWYWWAHGWYYWRYWYFWSTWFPY